MIAPATPAPTMTTSGFSPLGGTVGLTIVRASLWNGIHPKTFERRRLRVPVPEAECAEADRVRLRRPPDQPSGIGVRRDHSGLVGRSGIPYADVPHLKNRPRRRGHRVGRWIGRVKQRIRDLLRGFAGERLETGKQGVHRSRWKLGVGSFQVQGFQVLRIDLRVDRILRESRKYGGEPGEVLQPAWCFRDGSAHGFLYCTCCKM